jgi:hypothetical protein
MEPNLPGAVIMQRLLKCGLLPAVKGNFARELISNGRLRAVTEATVQFRVHEMIREVHVINGQRVRQGDTLAVLEEFPFANQGSTGRSTRWKRQGWNWRMCCLGMDTSCVTALKYLKISGTWQNKERVQCCPQ